MKSAIVRATVDFLTQDFVILVGEDVRAFKRELSRYCEADAIKTWVESSVNAGGGKTGFFTGLKLKSGGYAPVIWVRRPSLRAFIHESLHCATYLMDTRGIRVSYDNDEVLAYLLEHIVGTALKQVKWG